MASSMSRSNVTTPTRSATAATWSSREADTSAGRVWTAWAIRRARHTGTSNATTRAHTFGSRCRRVSASRISPSPAWVDIPIAAANAAPAAQSMAGISGSWSGSRLGSPVWSATQSGPSGLRWGAG